jgi:UDP:flavonoid glycosyltransferase YjiC (YdhE family)
MHAILATLGTDGDVFPHVGLGVKLRSRGHQVTLAAPETYRALADSLGLGFRPLARSEPSRQRNASKQIQGIQGTKSFMAPMRLVASVPQTTPNNQGAEDI